MNTCTPRPAEKNWRESTFKVKKSINVRVYICLTVHKCIAFNECSKSRKSNLAGDCVNGVTENGGKGEAFQFLYKPSLTLLRRQCSSNTPLVRIVFCKFAKNSCLS